MALATANSNVRVSLSGDIKSKARAIDVTQAVERNKNRITAIVSSRVRDKAEADDIVQDVFIEFLESYDLGVAIESLGAWLVRVAQNKIVDRFRKKKIRDDYLLAESQPEETTDTARPDDEAGNGLIRRAIIAALETLPKDQREVFTLHELEGKSFEEISKQTGMKINTLLSRKRYAMIALRERLQEVYNELES